MSKINFTIFFIILFLYGCTNSPNRYTKIDEFIKQHNSALNITNYDCIVVLNEEGTCMTCNRTFSIEMGNYIGYNNILYIVASSGANIDIAAYLEKQNEENIIIDLGNKFSELKLIEHPAIIVLGEHKIDTIIEIQLENINENLNNFSSTIERRF